MGTGRERLLIDTGSGASAWIKTLADVLKKENVTVKAALITHWHHDHINGIPALREVQPNVKIFKSTGHNIDHPLDGTVVDGQEFHVEGATLRAYFTPGHTADHMCFLLKEENALFTGDNVLGHGTSVFEDLKVYLDSLKRMQGIGAKKGYPGHGAVLDNLPFTIDTYIQHRQAREVQVVNFLKEAKEFTPDGEAGLNIMELVEKVYPDIPKEVVGAATHGVKQILDKLVAERKVKLIDDEWVLSDDGKSVL